MEKCDTQLIRRLKLIAKLNSIYGLTEHNNGAYSETSAESDIKDLPCKFWSAVRGGYILPEGMWLSKCDCRYCDTDSVKHIHNPVIDGVTAEYARLLKDYFG